MFLVYYYIIENKIRFFLISKYNYLTIFIEKSTIFYINQKIKYSSYLNIYIILELLIKRKDIFGIKLGWEWGEKKFSKKKMNIIGYLF